MRVTHSLVLASLTVLLAFRAYGQEFEVADVRVNQLDEPPSGAFLPGGQLTLRGVTMRTLVGIAFKESRVLPEVDAMAIALSPTVSQFNTFAADYLKGAPAWLNADRFDVVAKAPPGTPMDILRLMVQKLLADRFHLVVHRETRVMKVYALVAAKGGPKLKEAQGPGDSVCIRSISEDNVSIGTATI